MLEHASCSHQTIRLAPQRLVAKESRLRCGPDCYWKYHLYAPKTFSDWICHGIFFKAKQIRFRWVKICSSPGILLWLSNVNQKNWDIVQILIYVLGPVRYGREEKINNWTFALSLSVWVISSWRLKMVLKKVWNSLSVM